jgi:hypothetical protein
VSEEDVFGKKIPPGEYVVENGRRFANREVWSNRWWNPALDVGKV